MNCQEFEQVVADLAADNLPSVRGRVSAMTHAASCEHCDARLTAEKTLNAGLAAVAERTRTEQASPQLRQSLRAAFEAQQAKQNQAAVEPAAITAVPGESWAEKIKAFFQLQPNWNWALAGAAAIVVIAVGVSIWWQQQTPSKSNVVASASPSPTMTPLPKEPKVEAPQPEPATNVASRQQPVEAKNARRLAQPRRQREAQAGQNDLAANFIPLSSAAGSATPDESLVVRVDVPRTTLIAMGLPLNIERGNEMVKADLRVGFDGVPLAIRLVRQ